MINPVPPDDPHEAEQAAQQAVEQLESLKDEAAIRMMATDPNGRHFLRLLLTWTGLTAPSGSERREGERDIGRRLLVLMDEVDPMLYPSLVSEQAAAEVVRRAALKKATSS